MFRTSHGFLLLCAALLAAAPAASTPLNLNVGDVIDSIEWDALASNGDGGNYDFGPNTIVTDGQLTSVTIQGPVTNGLTGVTFQFAADLLPGSWNFNIATMNANVVFTTSAATNPDVTVIQNGNIILTGDFVGNFIFGGALTSPTLLSAGVISVTGGDPNLVAAIGATAQLNITASVFGFLPSLATLAGDGNVFNSDFFVEFSGTLKPIDPSPFVPEPGTAVLLGAGLVGLLALARRARQG